MKNFLLQADEAMKSVFFYTWKWYISISSIRFLQFHTIATCVKSNVVFVWNHLNLVFFVKQTEMYIFPDASRFVFLQPLSKLQLQLFLEVTELSTLCAFGSSFWEMALATLQAFNDVDLWGFSDGMRWHSWISGIWYCWCFFLSSLILTLAPVEDRWLLVGRRNPG